MMTGDACRAPDVKTPAWSHHALQTTPWPPAQHFLIFFIIITHCWLHFIITCSIIRILILEKTTNKPPDDSDDSPLLTHLPVVPKLARLVPIKEH